MPLPPSIPDTQLGLSPAEIHLLRHHQGVALAAAPSYASSTLSSSQRAYSNHAYSAGAGRGRGSVRSSAASSRAGSTGSPAGQGRLVLDAGSLSVLGAHFERVMGRIQERVDYLSAQTTMSTTSQSRRAASTVANADAEIARFKEILRQIDELEMEFDKVRHIRDIVKSFRARVEGLGGRMRR